MGLDRNGDLEVDDPLDEALHRITDDEVSEFWDSLCVICGKTLVKDRDSMLWACPLHGTRGAGRR